MQTPTLQRLKFRSIKQISRHRDFLVFLLNISLSLLFNILFLTQTISLAPIQAPTPVPGVTVAVAGSGWLIALDVVLWISSLGCAVLCNALNPGILDKIGDGQEETGLEVGLQEVVVEEGDGKSGGRGGGASVSMAAGSTSRLNSLTSLNVVEEQQQEEEQLPDKYPFNSPEDIPTPRVVASSTGHGSAAVPPCNAFTRYEVFTFF